MVESDKLQAIPQAHQACLNVLEHGGANGKEKSARAKATRPTKNGARPSIFAGPANIAFFESTIPALDDDAVEVVEPKGPRPNFEILEMGEADLRTPKAADP